MSLPEEGSLGICFELAVSQFIVPCLEWLGEPTNMEGISSFVDSVLAVWFSGGGSE